MNLFSRASIVLPVFLLMLGCAGTPDPHESSTTPLVSVSILSDKTIASRYGIERIKNPFFPQGVLILPSREEFIVLELAILSKSSVHVEFDYARIVSEVGTRIGDFLDKDALIQYWERQANVEWIEARTMKIEANYLPGFVFDRKAGKRSYILVVSGKRPLTRPFTVEARVWVNGEEYSFAIPVTE